MRVSLATSVRSSIGTLRLQRQEGRVGRDYSLEQRSVKLTNVVEDGAGLLAFVHLKGRCVFRDSISEWVNSRHPKKQVEPVACRAEGARG